VQGQGAEGDGEGDGKTIGTLPWSWPVGELCVHGAPLLGRLSSREERTLRDRAACVASHGEKWRRAQRTERSDRRALCSKAPSASQNVRLSGF
jgi:hypothetical protein